MIPYIPAGLCVTNIGLLIVAVSLRWHGFWIVFLLRCGNRSIYNRHSQAYLPHSFVPDVS